MPSVSSTRYKKADENWSNGWMVGIVETKVEVMRFHQYTEVFFITTGGV
jgi:hypothetical protein